MVWACDPRSTYPQIKHVKAENEPQWCGFIQYEPRPGFNPQNYRELGSLSDTSFLSAFHNFKADSTTQETQVTAH